jgi:1-acyl-sn-glycerol-3-phosphate acyltransferase
VSAVPILLTGTADSHSPECGIPDDVLIQFGPPDDEHLLLETYRGTNKYIKKECIKLVITQNYFKIDSQRAFCVEI